MLRWTLAAPTILPSWRQPGEGEPENAGSFPRYGTMTVGRWPEGGPPMKWLLRPSVLIAVSVLVVAGLLVLRPRPVLLVPSPGPVGENDLEVGWLNPATSVGEWERFV